MAITFFRTITISRKKYITGESLVLTNNALVIYTRSECSTGMAFTVCNECKVWQSYYRKSVRLQVLSPRLPTGGESGVITTPCTASVESAVGTVEKINHDLLTFKHYYWIHTCNKSNKYARLTCTVIAKQIRENFFLLTKTFPSTLGISLAAVINEVVLGATERMKDKD